MSFGRLLLRSAILALVVIGAVALGVTFRRVVLAHWLFVVALESCAVVAFVATEGK